MGDRAVYANRAFICKAPALGVNMSCACTGISDEFGFGGACGVWGAEVAWCYTSPHCPRATPRENTTLWVTGCYLPATSTAMTTEAITGPTTPIPTTTPVVSCHDRDPAMYLTPAGECRPCVDSCMPSETLVGTCRATTSPECVACDPTCETCTGIRSDQCTLCAAGRFQSREGHGCVVACPRGQWGSVANRTCDECHDTCETCAQPGETSCLSCVPTGSLFLSADNGTCTSECHAPSGSYKDVASQRCRACAVCTGTQFRLTACAEFTVRGQ